jgi:hypothetical protein
MADPIATAADYADAIMTARRAKNTLFLLLLLILLVQMTLFFLARQNVVKLDHAPAAAAPSVEAATSQPTSAPVVPSERVLALLEYVTGVSAYLGVVLTLVLAIVLLLIVKIMLVGRLIGVARLTSAFIWTVVLFALLFPWQAFWADYEFKLPGVLYTWDELVHRVNAPAKSEVLFWARFVAFPAVALIILLSIQIKSRRGLQQALGEANYESPSSPIA